MNMVDVVNEDIRIRLSLKMFSYAIGKLLPI